MSGRCGSTTQRIQLLASPHRTHSLTPAPTQSLIYSLSLTTMRTHIISQTHNTHCQTQGLTSLKYSLTNYFTRSFTHSLTHTFTNSVRHTYSLRHSLRPPFTHSLPSYITRTHSLTRPLTIHSLIHAPISPIQSISLIQNVYLTSIQLFSPQSWSVVWCVSIWSWVVNFLPGYTSSAVGDR